MLKSIPLLVISINTVDGTWRGVEHRISRVECHFAATITSPNLHARVREFVKFTPVNRISVPPVADALLGYTPVT